jgi:hypothetical protein
MSHFTHKLVRTLGQLDSTPQTGGVSYFWGTPPYVESSGRLLVSNSTVLERPVGIGFNAVFFAVREAFLVILLSLAAGGASFCS